MFGQHWRSQFCWHCLTISRRCSGGGCLKRKIFRTSGGSHGPYDPWMQNVAGSAVFHDVAASTGSDAPVKYGWIDKVTTVSSTSRDGFA